MAGIYIHIPFCKQACHYCDFHFSTSLKKKPALVEALCTELQLRNKEFSGAVDTIYFGGGTPSLLEAEELQQIFETIQANYDVHPEAEVTLEANPDDLTPEKISMLASSPINRLSIGVQSFFEEDLKMMNRAHNQTEALRCIALAKKHFDNLSIDLIYGIPGMSTQRWTQNLQTALELDVPHISSYALTVEPRTALRKLIDTGKIDQVDDSMAKEHYQIMVRLLKEAGYVNYEFSNFGKEGYFSRNNTAYWFGEPYIGIGPSAHSFDGLKRKWNISNNSLYIKSLEKKELPLEEELLSKNDRYNELVMTRLRTQWGINLREVATEFGTSYLRYLLREAASLQQRGMLERIQGSLHITPKAKFLGDGVAAELFRVEDS